MPPTGEQSATDAPPASSANPLEELQAHLTKKEAEIKELKTQHLLDLAEMENVRMRARRDVDNERAFAVTGMQPFERELTGQQPVGGCWWAVVDCSVAGWGIACG